MKIFTGRYILIEKFSPPAFIGLFLTIWRNKKKQIVKIQVHKANKIKAAFLHFSKEEYKNIIWILPAKKIATSRKKKRAKKLTPEALLFWSKIIGQSIK